jgi:hypothetical protein
MTLIEFQALDYTAKIIFFKDFLIDYMAENKDKSFKESLQTLDWRIMDLMTINDLRLFKRDLTLFFLEGHY